MSRVQNECPCAKFKVLQGRTCLLQLLDATRPLWLKVPSSFFEAGNVKPDPFSDIPSLSDQIQGSLSDLKESCEEIESIRVILGHDPSRYDPLITSAKTLLPHKEMYSHVLGVKVHVPLGAVILSPTKRSVHFRGVSGK